jgi:ABC-2 type transport system permease protein
LRDIQRHSRLKIAFCTVSLLAFGAGAYFLAWEGFRFLGSFPVIGPFLAERLLYVFCYCLFALLMASTLVTAYLVFYKSEDQILLLTLPLSWEAVWTKKFLEVLTFSAWALLFLALPFLAAYGRFKKAGTLYYLLGPLHFAGMAWVSCALGILAAALFFFIFRKKRWRRGLLWLSILGAMVLFSHYRQEAVSYEIESSPVELVNRLLPHFQASFVPVLPHAWTAQAVSALAKSLPQASFFPGWLTLINGLFLFQIGFLTARSVYRESWFCLGESECEAKGRGRRSWLDGFLRRIPGVPSPWRALIGKDIRLFFRDPVQWSQFLMFFGILAIYFANLRALRYDALDLHLKNVVYLLNVASLLVCLASLAGRFAFPMFSLEGNRFWLVGLSPLTFEAILAEKFWLSASANFLITASLTILSSNMLQVGPVLAWVGFFAAAAASLTLSALAVGMGAILPDFRTDNPVKTVSSFSGTLAFILEFVYVLMLIAVLALVVKDAAARPDLPSLVTYPPALAKLAFMLALSLAFGWIPLAIARRRLEKLEY